MQNILMILKCRNCHEVSKPYAFNIDMYIKKDRTAKKQQQKNIQIGIYLFIACLFKKKYIYIYFD